MHWLVRPTGLPLIRRRCLHCGSARHRPYGKFRVNANHKLLDVWLLALCVRCGKTIKLTVLERVNVQTIQPYDLSRFHDNDAGLAAELLAAPNLSHRNAVSVDWDDAWTLEKTDDGSAETTVHFARPIPVRRTRLLAAGLEVSVSEVRRLIDDGSLISKERLTVTSSNGFTFWLTPPRR